MSGVQRGRERIKGGQDRPPPIANAIAIANASSAAHQGLSVAHRERLEIASRVAHSASNELSTKSAAIPSVHNQLPMSGASPGKPMARLHR